MIELLRLRQFLLRLVYDGKIDEAVRHVGVAVAEGCLHRERALMEPFGVAVPSFRRIHVGKVVEDHGEEGMIDAERLLLDRKRALEEPFRFGESSQR